MNSPLNAFMTISDRTQAVVSRGYKSSALRVTTGVPQGSSLGPLLFTICMNNIMQQQRCAHQKQFGF